MRFFLFFNEAMISYQQWIESGEYTNIYDESEEYNIIFTENISILDEIKRQIDWSFDLGRNALQKI